MNTGPPRNLVLSPRLAGDPSRVDREGIHPTRPYDGAVRSRFSAVGVQGCRAGSRPAEAEGRFHRGVETARAARPEMRRERTVDLDDAPVLAVPRVERFLELATLLRRDREQGAVALRVDPCAVQAREVERMAARHVKERTVAPLEVRR